MPKSIRRVMVPIDHSEPSLEAAWVGLMIASAVRASLVLVHVQEMSTLELFYVNYSEMDTLSHDEFCGSVLKYVDDPYSEDFCAAINKGVLEMEFERCNSKPGLAICRYAQANKVDLIIMGSRGRSNIKELVIGSVSSEVVHHAPCPVTIVR